jgi:predicted O-methyltransferase YrrM
VSHTEAARAQITALEADPSLADPADLAGRADLLDALDLWLAAPAELPADLARRAGALRDRAEAMDEDLADDIRARIIAEGQIPASLRAELRRYATGPAPGGRDADDQYDCLDALISRVLRIATPAGQIAELPHGMVAYQPTPGRWLLDLADVAKITAQDTFVDIGAGLGHVATLVALLSGARAVGIEIEPAYVAIARSCAEGLGLSRASFRAEDARRADLSDGTVFYLYTPFTGEILGQVLTRLRREAAARPIRICAYGPCVPTIEAQDWLRRPARCGPIMIFDSLP